MLTELKFVQGAVAKKDFVPALTHFAISEGRVRGYNGMMALCSPIPFDVKCNPKAEPLIKAIGNCTDTIQLAMTKAGRLSVRSGKFKAFIDCVEGDTPHVLPEGQPIDLDGMVLLEALKVVSPFIGTDASRPWSNGVLLEGQSAFATNNITAVEYWTGASVPRPLNIPSAAVKELLRIDEPLNRIQLTDTSVTFHFEGERWLRTQLLATEWPDLRKILSCPSNAQPLDELLFEALEQVKPFVDKLGRIRFKGGGKIATHQDDSEGACYEMDGFDHTGVYQIDMLNLLKGVVTSIDWSTYPSPCMFFGDRLRGAIIGMRT
jgi:DNA polymerase III sliding clamp (beta) subunit (PCNA family)